MRAPTEATALLALAALVGVPALAAAQSWPPSDAYLPESAVDDDELRRWVCGWDEGRVRSLESIERACRDRDVALCAAPSALDAVVSRYAAARARAARGELWDPVPRVTRASCQALERAHHGGPVPPECRGALGEERCLEAFLTRCDGDRDAIERAQARARSLVSRGTEAPRDARIDLLLSVLADPSSTREGRRRAAAELHATPAWLVPRDVARPRDHPGESLGMCPRVGARELDAVFWGRLASLARGLWDHGERAGATDCGAAVHLAGASSSCEVHPGGSPTLGIVALCAGAPLDTRIAAAIANAEWDDETRALGSLDELEHLVRADDAPGACTVRYWESLFRARRRVDDAEGARSAAAEWARSATTPATRADAWRAVLRTTALADPGRIAEVIEAGASAGVRWDPITLAGAQLSRSRTLEGSDPDGERAALGSARDALAPVRSPPVSMTLALELHDARAGASDPSAAIERALDYLASPAPTEVSILLPELMRSLTSRARTVVGQGQLARAESELGRALETVRRIRRTWSERERPEQRELRIARARVLTLLGAVALRRGDRARGVSYLRRASVAGAVALAQLDVPGAVREQLQALDAMRALDDVMTRALLEGADPELARLALRASLDRKARSLRASWIPSWDRQSAGHRASAGFDDRDLVSYFEGAGPCGPPERGGASFSQCLDDAHVDAFADLRWIAPDPLVAGSEPMYAAVVYRRDRRTIRCVPLGSGDDLDATARALAAALARPDGAWEEPARQLDDALRPLADALGPSRRTALSTDGWLARIPLGVAFDGETFFLDRVPGLWLVPSPRALTEAPAELSATPPHVVVFASPEVPPHLDLPGAREEARAIARAWPGAELLTGVHATEDALFHHRELGIVHFATHGIDLGEARGGPTLILSPDRAGGDGALDATEIAASARLRGTELVVLSACESGGGDPRRGVGIQGLRLALMAAGARSVVSSLWAVDDVATRDFMTELYRRLLRGERRVSALREAAMHVRRGRPHPHYWSAFLLEGAAGPVVSSPGSR